MIERPDEKLRIAVTSSALFALAEDDARVRPRHPLAPGAAFPLVRRLLAINRVFDAADPPVDVVLLSRADPDSGLRILCSIAAHGLDIRRALFTSGRSTVQLAQALHSNLFLSSNAEDVRRALSRGVAAGHVGIAAGQDDPADGDLRIAFDFDGVLADDASERVYQQFGLETFQEAERARADEPMCEGPLAGFCRRLSVLQRQIDRRTALRMDDAPRICTAIVTSRGAPAHTRVVTTLRSWGVTVDTAFFLGGLPKAPVLAALRPHIFFDDQLLHLVPPAAWPGAHVPCGIVNDAPAWSGQADCVVQ